MATFVHEIDFTTLSSDILQGNPGLIPAKVIPFNATALYIYNYTAYWLYFKDADTYIAPFWTNACRLLTHTTQYEYVEVKSPFGLVQNPTETSYQLRLVWTDDPAVYVAGSDVNVGGSLAFNIQLLSPTTTTVRTRLKTIGLAVISLCAKPNSVAPVTDWSLPSRQSLGIHNTGPGTLYVGSQTELGLAPIEGWELGIDDRYLLDVSDQVEIWAVADLANTLVELIEIA